jgi:hypothetical protein
MRSVQAEQSGYQVIARQECVVPGGGKIVMWMMFCHNTMVSD